ncbi:N-acetylglucosamine kinase [Mucilaginibacter myungsuensis]|uniref:N-acetylglucosamine kinase n=1 Tax=Mucilaginibacter myungsuensis TaxID=649104 RepID=A0A929PVM9_9SPHI|nr:N-acetylglucosamine kinase [Mucilaginibacter myungsuensis]MBE9661191.1 N-acetylglucosamine kinase [Mucilaginibacter myungsuensis]MDN3597336.1 N-acetylglucosamine kinase [Mucilaginibacter myungsuensis]
MILVADSGSSKTDWLLDNPGGEPSAYSTDGLNPYFLTEKEIIKKLQDQLQGLLDVAHKVTEIYFFGAGCSSPDRHEVVSNALSSVFPKAYISVDSDLLGCAYATCGHEKGICCILGTGSNISFFDGEEVAEGKHGLGFVLGDEGAGTWLGKSLVTDYLYGNMPADIAKQFGDAYQLDKETVISKVYMQAGGNAYLASFTRFLSKIRETEYAQQVLSNSFTEFIETNIKSYPEYRRYKCHFVGSIAYHFADELKAHCATHHIQVGKIIPKPIHELLKFILVRNLAV